jgi:DUF4097 and DUF4098 domain-containing protein YvlB
MNVLVKRTKCDRQSPAWTLLQVLLPVGLVLTTATALRAADQGNVRRGEPQREGRVWVEHVDCGVPVRDGGRLVLRTDFGAILVKTGSNDRMNCQVRLEAYTGNASEARRTLRTFELSVRPTDGGAYLIGKATGGHRHSLRMNAEFLIAVPVRFNLDMETQGGDIDVQRLLGELHAHTAGGDIRTGDVTGPVRVETQGGSIVLGNVGQRLDATTAGGSIRVGGVRGDAALDTSGGEIVAGLITGTVKAQTAGGDIVLRGATGPVEAETAGGQIQIGNCGASVRAETAGGNIRLEGARGLVKVETAGGSIDLFRVQSAVRAANAAGPILAEFSANRQTFAPSHLETSVGDVRVFLPPDLPLDIVAVIDEAAGHKISSEFPFTVHGQGDAPFGSGTVRGRCALNGGGKELSIHTVTGNIEIHKVDSQILNQIRQRQQLFWMNWQGREERRMQEEMQHLQQKLEELRDQMEKQQAGEDNNEQ